MNESGGVPMRSITAALLCWSVAPLGVTTALPVEAQVPVKEWRVPYEGSRPRDPYVDAHGRVWFVGQEGNYVAYLEPSSGKFKRYEIAKGTNPHNLVVDAAGRVWFSGNRNGTIGWLDAETGKATVHP